jgi:hypothetical protein
LNVSREPNVCDPKPTPMMRPIRVCSIPVSCRSPSWRRRPELDGSWRSRAKRVCTDQAPAERPLLSEGAAICRWLLDRPTAATDGLLPPLSSLVVRKRQPPTPARASVSTS